MIGETVWMELRTSWKGVLVFVILVLLVAGGIPQFYPTFSESMREDLEGAENVTLQLPIDADESMLQLAWEPLAAATGYIVIRDDRSSMVTGEVVYTGAATNISLPYNASAEEDQYFAVIALVDNTTGAENATVERAFIGMASTAEPQDAFAEMINDPAYSAFTQGRQISATEVTGFISFEVFSWWWMLVGLFIAYHAVGTVTRDFEGLRMDLIFSTPISRRRYLTEKFAASAIVALILTLLAAVALIAGLVAIGESDTLPPDRAFGAFIGCWPFLMTIGAFGILAAVLFKRTKAAMGVSFAFVFAGFIFTTIAGFADALEPIKYLSIMTYWDYHSVLFDGVFYFEHFVGLIVASVLILEMGVQFFSHSDIPAN